MKINGHPDLIYKKDSLNHGLQVLINDLRKKYDFSKTLNKDKSKFSNKVKLAYKIIKRTVDNEE